VGSTLLKKKGKHGGKTKKKEEKGKPKKKSDKS